MIRLSQVSVICCPEFVVYKLYMSHGMRFPTMLYVGPANLRSACAYALTDQSLCMWHEYSISVKLLTDHRLMFLILTGGCTGLSETTLVKIPHCWKSHVTAHIQTHEILVQAKAIKVKQKR